MSAEAPPPSASAPAAGLSPAEAALRESQSRLGLVLQAAQAGLWDWNLVTQECHYSPEWKGQLGLAGAALSPAVSEWEGRLHPEDHERVMTAVTAALAGPAEGLDLEYRLRHKDQAYRWMQAHCRILRDAGRAVRLTGCHLDITERKSLEVQFQQAQKWEAMGRLGGGVAHDFNNLLTIILGYSDILLTAADFDEVTRDYLMEVKKAGERASSLTRQLLTFSRKQPLEPVPLNLNQVVGDFEKMLKRLLGADVELSTVLAPELGMVDADPGQLEQVLMNLAINARDAMPQGGKLSIETAGVTLGEAYCRKYPGVKPGRYILLAVSDTGYGLDEAAQARLFEPFINTREEGGEPALGLAMVFGFIKQSGGHIAILSEPGQGTTYKIHLPETEAPPDTATGDRGLPTGSETILLVEDDDNLRRLTRQILQGRGYTVLDADRGEAALAVAQQYPGPIHLLVSDVVMPGMNGHRLAGDVTALHPAIKTLFISGYADETLSRYGVLASQTGFLPKPFTIETLPVKVRQVLDQA
jgi:PAS domain S-box-containing protein